MADEPIREVQFLKYDKIYTVFRPDKYRQCLPASVRDRVNFIKNDTGLGRWNGLPINAVRRSDGKIVVVWWEDAVRLRVAQARGFPNVPVIVHEPGDVVYLSDAEAQYWRSEAGSLEGRARGLLYPERVQNWSDVADNAVNNTRRVVYRGNEFVASEPDGIFLVSDKPLNIPEAARIPRIPKIPEMNANNAAKFGVGVDAHIDYLPESGDLFLYDADRLARKVGEALNVKAPDGAGSVDLYLKTENLPTSPHEVTKVIISDKPLPGLVKMTVQRAVDGTITVQQPPDIDINKLNPARDQHRVDRIKGFLNDFAAVSQRQPRPPPAAAALSDVCAPPEPVKNPLQVGASDGKNPPAGAPPAVKSDTKTGVGGSAQVPLTQTGTGIPEPCVAAPDFTMTVPQVDRILRGDIVNMWASLAYPEHIKDLNLVLSKRLSFAEAIKNYALLQNAGGQSASAEVLLKYFEAHPDYSQRIVQHDALVKQFNEKIGGWVDRLNGANPENLPAIRGLINAELKNFYKKGAAILDVGNLPSRVAVSVKTPCVGGSSGPKGPGGSIPGRVQLAVGPPEGMGEVGGGLGFVRSEREAVPVQCPDQQALDVLETQLSELRGKIKAAEETFQGISDGKVPQSTSASSEELFKEIQRLNAAEDALINKIRIVDSYSADRANIEISIARAEANLSAVNSKLPEYNFKIKKYSSRLKQNPQDSASQFKLERAQQQLKAAKELAANITNELQSLRIERGVLLDKIGARSCSPKASSGNPAPRGGGGGGGGRKLPFNFPGGEKLSMGPTEGRGETGGVPQKSGTPVQPPRPEPKAPSSSGSGTLVDAGPLGVGPHSVSSGVSPGLAPRADSLPPLTPPTTGTNAPVSVRPAPPIAASAPKVCPEPLSGAELARAQEFLKVQRILRLVEFSSKEGLPLEFFGLNNNIIDAANALELNEGFLYDPKVLEDFKTVSQKEIAFLQGKHIENARGPEITINDALNKQIVELQHKIGAIEQTQKFRSALDGVSSESLRQAEGFMSPNDRTLQASDDIVRLAAEEAGISLTSPHDIEVQKNTLHQRISDITSRQPLSPEQFVELDKIRADLKTLNAGGVVEKVPCVQPPTTQQPGSGASGAKKDAPTERMPQVVDSDTSAPETAQTGEVVESSKSAACPSSSSPGSSSPSERIAQLNNKIGDTVQSLTSEGKLPIGQRNPQRMRALLASFAQDMAEQAEWHACLEPVGVSKACRIAQGAGPANAMIGVLMRMMQGESFTEASTPDKMAIDAAIGLVFTGGELALPTLFATLGPLMLEYMVADVGVMLARKVGFDVPQTPFEYVVDPQANARKLQEQYVGFLQGQEKILVQHPAFSGTLAQSFSAYCTNLPGIDAAHRDQCTSDPYLQKAFAQKYIEQAALYPGASGVGAPGSIALDLAGRGQPGRDQRDAIRTDARAFKGSDMRQAFEQSMQSALDRLSKESPTAAAGLATYLQDMLRDPEAFVRNNKLDGIGAGLPQGVTIGAWLSGVAASNIKHAQERSAAVVASCALSCSAAEARAKELATQILELNKGGLVFDSPTIDKIRSAEYELFNINKRLAECKEIATSTVCPEQIVSGVKNFENLLLSQPKRVCTTCVARLELLQQAIFDSMGPQLTITPK